MKLNLLFIFAAIIIGVSPAVTFAADGDLAWQFNGTPSSMQYTDVAVSADGVYAPYLVSWGEVAVQKRNLDNSSGWKVNFPIPTGAWFNGFPRIAADSTGVYVALSSAVTNDVRNGTLSMAKISPVDGSIISLKNSNAPGYVNVTNIDVDSNGVYVAGGSSADRGYGGTSWRLEKWGKDLSGASPLWGYSSRQSDGNSADYYGPLGFAMNSQYIYLGGSRLNAGPGTYGVRIEKINKTTGVAEWVRLENYGTGTVGVLALSSTNLYSVISSQYLGVNPSGTPASVLEMRPLENSPAIWTQNAPGRIQALLVDGSSGLYRAYVGAGDTTSRSRTIIDKVSLIDGSKVGSITINSGVYSVTKWPSGFTAPAPIVNNLASDNFGIFLAGKDETTMSWGTVHAPRIEKYNHFGSESSACGPANGVSFSTAPTPNPTYTPNNLCTVGTTSAVTTNASYFNWTCNGPDGVPDSIDDVSCSASKSVTTANLNAPNCQIPSGSNSCNIAVSWNSSNTVGPTSIRQDDTQFSIAVSETGTSRTITYGPHTFKFYDNEVEVTSDQAIANCDGNSTWNYGINVCDSLPPPSLPPIITINANPNIIRSGQTAPISISIKAGYGMKCILSGVNLTPIDLVHIASEFEKTYNFTTRPLKSTQVVNIACTDEGTIKESREVRVEVIGNVQET